jgi:hypothetical protein
MAEVPVSKFNDLFVRGKQLTKHRHAQMWCSETVSPTWPLS